MSMAQGTAIQPLEPVRPAREDFSFEAAVRGRIEDGFRLNDPFFCDPFSSSPLSSAPSSRAASPVTLGARHSTPSALSSAPASRAASPLPMGSGHSPTPSKSYESPPAKMQLSGSRPRSSKNEGKPKRPSQMKKEKEKGRKHRGHKRAEKKGELSASDSVASNPLRERSFKKYVAASDPLPTGTKAENYR
ncbi:hypothetical protein DXG01_014360, partial [Tephrocybe rancida]